jgi:hypothetical protein
LIGFLARLATKVLKKKFVYGHQLQCRHFELHLGFVHPTSS